MISVTTSFKPKQSNAFEVQQKLYIGCTIQRPSARKYVSLYIKHIGSRQTLHISSNTGVIYLRWMRS